ncbi:MAG: cytochrome b N-terminal domain-containing protein [Planctomycetes bacterium]|nr:cytochrome b N-terminal domain-containing protein [Planctomycetota bacterium]
MARLIKRILGWTESRSGVAAFVAPIVTHRVPRDAKWWYVFGSASLMFFMIQVVTGILLATLYVPSAAEAFSSLQNIDQQVPFGWMLRALHAWSSNAMVLMVAIHMSQVFLHASFKFPRELMWMVGVLLLFGTLALAFTGQIMRWDQDAYWGLGIGASIVDRVPLMGNSLRNLMLGGPYIGGATLSRFFALHVFVLPGLMIALIGAHMALILKNGISEMPKPGMVVDPETYKEEYEERVRKTGVPFMPDAAQRDMVFCGAMLIAVGVLAAWLGPVGPNGVPDPTVIDANPRPDFAFLWIFTAMALMPPQIETAVLLIAPVVLGLFLLGLPLISNRGERAPSKRPGAVLGFVLVVTALGTLSWMGVVSAWSPVMDAWTSLPTPVQYLAGRTPLELQGALVMQHSQCRNCHSLGGAGGLRGPSLDDIGSRKSWDQLVRQVQQGGGNMPAYGKNLSSAETTAVVAFMATLRSSGAPASVIPGAMEVQPSPGEAPRATLSNAGR